MTDQSHSAAPRRGFLARAGLGALALLGGATTRAHALELPAAPDPWLGPLTGKHRMYFDATTINGGMALGYCSNWLNTAPEGYKANVSEFSAVVGVRHLAAVLVLNDAMWAKYKLGAQSNVTDPVTKAPTLRNIYVGSKPGDMRWPEAALDRLQARGVHVVACGMALSAIAGMVAGGAGVSADEAKTDFLSNLIPGAVAAPSGVFALQYAQEKGLAYCYCG